MLYKSFNEDKLSALGLGAMRLPVIDGNDAKIDVAKAEEMVDYAISNGINYFDTAWGYHNGNSEIILGKALSRHQRDSFYLATKFPGYDLENITNAKEIFAKQLEKCGVEYFDYYLFHNVCESNIDYYLDKNYGILDYFIEQKRLGKIRHLGLSTHGELGTMKRFLDAYGKDVEFCQIQLNYLDWTYQSAKEKVELIRSYGLPVWVMEPLRGGKLAVLPAVAERKLKTLRPYESAPSWAFRFLQSIEGVTMVLSGMSNMEQLSDNIKTFETEKVLNEAETAELLRIADMLLQKKLVPCTACHYCVSKCPQGLDIPTLLSQYNERNFSESGFSSPLKLPQDKQPSACLGCRSCEAVCPQKIKISETMADFKEKLQD